MEKFRIATFGFFQMVALVYGILGAAVTARAFDRAYEPLGNLRPGIYFLLTAYRDHGIWLILPIFGWVAFCSYHSSGFSRMNVDEWKMTISGTVLLLALLITGTLLLGGGLLVLFNR